MKPDADPPRAPADRSGRDSQQSTSEPVRTLDVHDAHLTAVVLGRQIDDLIRALNYATRTAGSGLEYAADVYDVLGSLGAALSKLPQACGQLTEFLRRQDADGNLRIERGFLHAGRPTLAVEAASLNLGQAAAAANVSATAFGRAQEAISGLSRAEPDRLSVMRTPPAARRGATYGTADQRRVIEP